MTAVKAGAFAARAAPKLQRAVAAVKRALPTLRRSCNSFAPGTLVLLADGTWTDTASHPIWVTGTGWTYADHLRVYVVTLGHRREVYRR